jgi:uncharacterized protein DUF4234
VALITCPDCGQSISDAAAACIHCGRPRDRAGAVSLSPNPVVPPITGSTSPAHDVGKPSPATATFPLFPVATHKFIILSICTFSIYELYWCYQYWKRLKTESGESLSPFWKACFAPLWGFSLFRRIRATAASNGVVTEWSAGVLGTFYFILSALWKLPDPWWLISLASWLPIIPVQQAAQRVNECHAASAAEGRNDNYTTANIVTIVIGGLLLVLAIVGTFMPE